MSAASVVAELVKIDALPCAKVEPSLNFIACSSVISTPERPCRHSILDVPIILETVWPFLPCLSVSFEVATTDTQVPSHDKSLRKCLQFEMISHLPYAPVTFSMSNINAFEYQEQYHPILRHI